MNVYKIYKHYPEHLVHELVIVLRQRGFDAYSEYNDGVWEIHTTASRSALVLFSGYGWVVTN